MSKDGRYSPAAASTRGGVSVRIRAEDAAEVLAGVEAGFADDPAAPGAALVLGAGAKVRVDHGHLLIEDGLGPYRRERRYNRATSGLQRLIIGARSGYLSLDALTWCEHAGISVLVVDDDGELRLGPATYRADDARLRRVQAAPPDALRSEIVVGLLGAKLGGQAQVCRGVLDAVEAAATIEGLAEAMHGTADVEALRALEASAAACYWDAWSGHPATTIHFARADASRVPKHWLVFEARRSLLGNRVMARRASDPLNATLNVLYKLAANECRMAALGVGLDPALGLLHQDARGFDALTYDLLEPLRPAVDRFALDLVDERTFTRRDFTERSDGSIRVAPRLVQELAATLPRWGRLIAPHAEALAHALGQAVRGQWSLRTPLTGAKLRRAQAIVKARKVAAKRAATAATSARAAARREDGTATLRGSCIECGGALRRPRDLRCERCQDETPGQARAARRRRGQAIAAAQAGIAEWQAEHSDDDRPSREAFAPIREALTGLKLTEIMTATGLSKSMASQIRSGRAVPHIRHWEALRALGAEIGSPRDDPS